MRERLSGIAAFVQAVEAGSFAQAAERMQMTRSAVGKTIARLEERLGVRLFHRTTRNQGLTEDGQAFYERCLRALLELRAGEAMLDFGRRCVAPILTRLAQQHPKLELDLNFNDRVVDLIEDGFDLAVRNGRLGDG